MRIKKYISSVLFLFLFADKIPANTVPFKLKYQAQSIDRDETRVAFLDNDNRSHML